MYNPRAFACGDRAELLDFVRANSFGILTSVVEGRPFASHLPFTVSDRDGGLVLRVHLARPNPQWRTLEGAEVLVIFPGPHAYVSPTAYDGTANVPTWNYVVVHASGTASLVHEPERLRGMLAELIAANEPAYQRQWDALPARYTEGMLGGIVGVEIRVSRLEGKYKLSQNRTMMERERVAAALDRRGEPGSREVAKWMRRVVERERAESGSPPASPPAARE
jgi:transcriptional regulator